uniref:Uncharacterized protein n=1 Tax=Physcomitrium patens TaxID=3218 RepID=A0A2K1IQN2_PHYPA|nr:hypothetical protein PHYPA_025710 [Physcomitrium patens]
MSTFTIQAPHGPRIMPPGNHQELDLWFGIVSWWHLFSLNSSIAHSIRSPFVVVIGALFLDGIRILGI